MSKRVVPTASASTPPPLLGGTSAERRRWRLAGLVCFGLPLIGGPAYAAGNPADKLAQLIASQGFRHQVTSDALRPITDLIRGNPATRLYVAPRGLLAVCQTHTVVPGPPGPPHTESGLTRVSLWVRGEVHQLRQETVRRGYDPSTRWIREVRTYCHVPGTKEGAHPTRYARPIDPGVLTLEDEAGRRMKFDLPSLTRRAREEGLVPGAARQRWHAPPPIPINPPSATSSGTGPREPNPRMTAQEIWH